MAVAIKLMLGRLMEIYASSTYYRGTIAMPVAAEPSAEPAPAPTARGSA
jgi:hypothetical protein